MTLPPSHCPRCGRLVIGKRIWHKHCKQAKHDEWMQRAHDEREAKKDGDRNEATAGAGAR